MVLISSSFSDKYIKSFSIYKMCVYRIPNNLKQTIIKFKNILEVLKDLLSYNYQHCHVPYSYAIAKKKKKNAVQLNQGIHLYVLHYQSSH